MASTAPHTAASVNGRQAPPQYGANPAGRRHPLVALAMVLPFAITLAVVFGGVDAVIVQASSVAGILGR
ncbi:hypothetical protein PJ985_15460 [Streptomyces sp. ACA25]|uniref:hypothetical protein n=1 Tax=Streptomyces sp. ACA25 TaxID=3022596 RepID=UPI002307105E|nr:hypothetical protein [Streptomyces sp. ACA25]MDB1088958.1 hypothetical protein [Streptomyces sp. ACA25]